VEKPQDTFIELFPTVTVIENSENIGFAKGNNIGIEHAKGEYILLLNSDTILKNNALSITKLFLENNSNVAVATARLEYPNGNVQHNCQRFPSIKYQLAELFRLQKIFPDIRRNLFGPFFDYDSVAYPDWVWGTFFMFRKDLLNQLPGKKLADDFFMYGEDMQWCMDFKLLGYKVAFLPQAHITHIVGGSGASKANMMRVNNEVFLNKYYPRISRIIIKILGWALS
jgi:hypothetical protein